MGAEHGSGISQKVQMVGEDSVGLSRNQTKIQVVQPPAGPNLHQVGGRGVSGIGTVYPINPAVDDRGTVTDASIDVAMPDPRHHYTKMSLNSANPTINLIDMIVGLSSTFTLDLTNTIALSSLTFSPALINAPTLNLGIGQRNVLFIVGHRTASELRYEVINGTGGGGISFPITPPVDVRGNVSTTQDINLAATVAHSTTMTLTGNISITFSNIPVSATQLEWEVEIKQDPTGGRTVSWPAAVTPVPVIDSGAGKTSIVVLRVNDGGTVIRTLLAPSVTGGGGEVFTWTADHDANGFALVDGRIADATDPTKILDFDLAGMTTGITSVFAFSFTTAKTITFPDAVGTVVLTPMTEDLDVNTFDIFDIDSFIFMSTVGTLGSLNVGFSALGSGGFRANILNAGQFQWTEENTLLMKLSEASSVTSLDVSGILAGEINLSETTGGDVGTIQQGTATLQYTTPVKHEFVVVSESILQITTDGIAMQGANFITTPQIGFSILGNLIEDDAGGLIITTVPGDDITFDDGTTIFGTIDATLFAINATPMQYTQIATPADPGLITLGKVFFNSADNRLTFRRRNDGDSAWINVDLEASAGVQDKIEEGDSKVEVIDTGTGQVDIFIDGATAKFRFLVAGFSPVVAGGVNLGTSTLPWEKLSIKDIEIETGGTLTVTKNNIVADAGGIIYNVPSGDVHTFQIAGNDSVIIDEDEIRFTTGRAHKIVAGPTAIQIISENLTDDIQLFTGAARSNVTVLIEDLKTSFFTDNTETVAYALQIVQNNDTPVDLRTIGNIDFIAEDSTSIDTIYARISASSQDVTNTSEDGLLQLGVVKAGVLTAGIDIESVAGVVELDFFNNPVKQFVAESRTNANRGAAGTTGRIIFNTDDGQLNIDDGTNWTLPDGTVT